MATRYELVQPNEWRRNLKSILSQEEKDRCFSWFLCGKRFRDSSSGLMILEIPTNVKFHAIDSGLISNVETSLRVVLIEKPNIRKLCDMNLIDGNCINYGEEELLSGDTLMNISNSVIDMGWDGVGIKHSCTTSESGADESAICHNATFVIRDDMMKNDPLPTCEFVNYAKKHNSRIRRKIPGFPTCEEIDNCFRVYSNEVVCKVLYEDLTKWWEGV